MPWLTPDSIPEGGICRPLWIPASQEWLAVVSGALAELAKEYNWEPFGAVTPAAAADRMLSMLDDYYSGSCQGGGMPLGVIIPYITTNPPIGTVPCDGTIYLDTDYPELWTVVDSAWKTDATHWQAPDLRNRFPVGAGDNYTPGDTGGEDAHSLTANENGTHNHLLYINNGGTVGNQYPMNSRPTNLQNAWSTAIQNSGLGTAHENRPPFLALNYAVVVDATA